MNTPKRALLFLGILIIGVVWVWFSRAAPGQNSMPGIPAPRQGFMAPDFALQDIEGETVRLSDLRGRPVLLNVWASWCSPCRAEMPAMQRLYQDYRERGFEILAVNSTSQDNPDQAVAFARELGLTFPILFDTTGDVARQYQVQALPSSYFIDPQGVIQEVVVGGPMAEALLRVRAEKLMEER